MSLWSCGEVGLIFEGLNMIAEAKPETAKMIVREHNAHAALLEIAKEALDTVTCDIWREVIRDAINLAEGKSA